MKHPHGPHPALSPVACRAITAVLGDLTATSDRWTHALAAGARRQDPHVVVGHALDALRQPVWVLRGDATVDHANAAASALAKQQHACIKMQGRSIRQLGVIDGDALRQAVHRLPAGKSPPMITAFHVAGHLQRVTLSLTCVAGNPSYSAAWPMAVALMVLDLPHADLSDSWLRLFARLHGLTRAELRVLTLLLQGKSVPEVAEGLGVAYSTARSHVRVLLEKTDSQRQSDLMRRVLG